MDSQTIRRVYKIFKLFLEIEDPPEELCDRFYEWLLNSAHAAEKDAVMWHIFNKYAGGEEFEQPIPDARHEELTNSVEADCNIS